MADSWDTLVDTGSSAMGWLDENPNAAAFITGATVATINYLNSAEDRKAAKAAIKEERENRKLYGGSSSGADTGYALSLTDGALAQQPGSTQVPLKPGALA